LGLANENETLHLMKTFPKRFSTFPSKLKKLECSPISKCQSFKMKNYLDGQIVYDSPGGYSKKASWTRVRARVQ